MKEHNEPILLRKINVRISIIRTLKDRYSRQNQLILVIVDCVHVCHYYTCPNYCAVGQQSREEIISRVRKYFLSFMPTSSPP
jgi:hypothetical protein